MATRVYLSNISPLWPRARQEEALRAAIEGYPRSMSVLADWLTPQQRRAHRATALTARGALLRPTARKGSTERIVVASLAVFAWSEGDMLKHLTAAAARGATVQVLDAGLEIGPGAGAEALHHAVEAFAAARKRQVEVERGRTGAMISARKREDRARTAAESIRAAWARRDIKTNDLLVHAGITLNTAKRYLGSRPIAQKARDASAKRQAGYLKVKRDVAT